MMHSKFMTAAQAADLIQDGDTSDVSSQLMREIGVGRPGLFTHMGKSYAVYVGFKRISSPLAADSRTAKAASNARNPSKAEQTGSSLPAITAKKLFNCAS
jgi:hypothetical protein